MDSWTLQGDSYSFLRSAPRTFSLCHRDGTPNHIEIFDIINVPSQSSAISETTCLCDIFGDDCESASLSSSPAVGAFVPPQREVEETAAASPLADDLNDSSGSYHTAQGSSEGEEGFEDSKDRLNSPTLQSESLQRSQTEDKGLSSGHPDVSEDTCPKSISPLPQLSARSPSSEVFSTGGSTPSPGHNSPFTLSTGRASSLSSSSVEKICSPSLSNPEQAFSEAESSRVTPTFLDNHKTPSHQSLTPTPSPPPRNIVNLSSESLNTQSFAEFRVAQVSPEPRSSYFNQNRSPSSELSELTSKDFSSGAISTPSPSFSGRELSPHSRDSPAQSPELKERPYSPNTQASSPFPELRTRISLPDLFARGSTPDIGDSTHTPELVSNPSTAGRDIYTTPENQDTRLSAESVSTSSTPAPRYTPPSPITSVTTYPELVESGDTAPSSGLLSVAETKGRSPSPGPSLRVRHISSPSGIGTQLSSPVKSYSLSPSPEVAQDCSPIELRHTSPSPEIRVTASSPEASRREWPAEGKSASASPFLHSHFDSAASRSLASSPHITGISYSVVQPEDRDSPPFPELLRLSTPQPDRTLVFQEARSPTPSRDSIQSSRAESAGTPQDSPQVSGFTSSVLQPEETLSHQPRYQTPSPKPKHLSPSPEARFQTPTSDKHHSPSPPERSIDPSPVAPSPEQRCHQSSPANLFTEYKPHYKETAPPLRNTPDVEESSSSVDIRETLYPAHFEKECVSPSFELDNGGKSVGVESTLSVVAVPSPVSTLSPSPFLAERKVDSSPTQQSIKREATPEEADHQESSSLTSFSEEKQAICPVLFQKEDTSNNLSVDIRSFSPNLIVSQARSPNISTLQGATSNSAPQELENPQPKLNTYSLNSESISSFESACRPELTRKQLLTSVRRENRERFTQDMAHHVHRRRTPSPPLTRFTPVHILAPEKPYRQWQNRSRSPSQVEASSNTGHLKQVVTNRESPDVASVDSNSQAQWVRLETQLEMENEMQLEEDREVVRGRIKEREMEREQKREERVPEKGKGWQGDASYRGEQVDLSFNARNRKGPASRRAAPTSREIRQGLPTVHSYSESLLAPRRFQQHSLLASQQDTRGVGPSRRLQPPALQNRNTTHGRVASNRPCRSSSSSMGSELDEADHEVKWFTDEAFSSLSSPEADYLDMYNSSHRSSTNISQPSTQDSPAGVNPAWLAYADFRGSAQKLDNDELSFQQPYAYYSDGLDQSRRYEMGSFECVDVAVEREDSRKARRGVPKRQIQLKRKNNADGKQDESSENSSPGLPVMLESSSLESHSSETFMRQHSTPEAMQECYPSELSPEPNQQNERKSNLQKSPSLDESCAKTKMATCLIKSVLSKKMHSVDKQPDEEAGEEESPSFEENSPPTEATASPLKESPKPTLSSSVQSDYSISSEGPSLRGEPSIKDEARTTRSFGVKSSNRPSSSSSSRSVTFSQTESEEADSESRSGTSSRSEIKSELKVQFDSKHSRTGLQRADGSKTWDKREGGESANATAGNTGAPSVTRACSMQARTTNRDQECENTEVHKQLQQGDKSAHTSNTPEITLKAVEKKKASLNVCLTPEAENKPEAASPQMTFREKEDREEACVDDKTEEDEGTGNNQVKVPIHKVRDVRRLVKNTYNLSFKASGTAMPSTVNDENQERGDKAKEGRIEEVKAEEERRLRQELRREEREEEVRLEKREEQKEEIKDSKLPTLSSPFQSRRNPLSRSQPMQIEYRAVCSKDEKHNISSIKKDSESLGEKSQASPKPAMEVNRESQISSRANTHSHSSRDMVISTLCQHDPNMAAATQEAVTVSDSESKPVRTDRKPPMLGSIPRQSSKDREVSTAVVLIRDGSSKSKTSTFSAQEDISTKTQAPAASPSPGPAIPGSHSVSMLLKEKGYQADIGAVVGDNQNAAVGKGVPHKHVNCLEIPLQTTTSSDESQIRSQRERTLSSSSALSGPSAVSENTDTPAKTREDEEVSIKPPLKDTAKLKSVSLLRSMQEPTQPPTKQKELGDFEAVKRLDPTFPPRSPAIRRFKPQQIEVKSLSKETQKQDMHTNTPGNNRPQAIEVKSIAKHSQKPVVPPKPSCKFKPADLGTMPNEAQRPSATTSTVRPHSEERSQTIVVSSPTIYRKISNESTSTSHSTRKIAVAAVSSIKPPPYKTTSTSNSNLSNQSAASPETDASTDRGQQQLSGSLPQSCSITQGVTTSAAAPTTTSAPSLTSNPGPVSDQNAHQAPAPVPAGSSHPSQPAVIDQHIQPPYPRMAYPHEQAVPVASSNTKQPTPISTTQVPGYTHQTYRRSLSGERSHRSEEMQFYASDDPPSYDERESFSPLMLQDLTTRRSNRYQPSSRPPPCSCTTGCPSHPGLTPPHSHRSPHNITPPAPTHSPGQALPYPGTQPPLRQHQCRPDPQPMSYQPGSPKSSPLGPSQPPAMYQPIHHPPPCPPHPSLMHACPADRPLQPSQHIDPRRGPVHRSPQQQPPGMGGAPYSDPVHGHSPGLPPMDPQYLCGPQSLGPSYGSEYGGDSSSLYSESSYGQAPRRVLLDPETGKYFYIEVPVQPLRKMLFDPETGQYVEVLIPQQAMSHSGLYPPSAAPYPSLHNPNMYAPAPQYMPYAAPPPPAHSQAQPQPPRYPEPSAAATMHPSGPGVNYSNPSGQGSKPEPQNHPPLDQSYLESMYYVPTGMNASPNPTPPDYYHKHPPNLPPTGGKRS
ncbi:serine/arginine repetitive matrix protein 2 [Notolabrus celidotus]|uniref:serine/arginine repetitive matrix protein 2 n=1 Tax=Notolabrus celidotus TaxID=1203425 RepID=UPI00148FB10B|nr:serine/arginine repetitive matrix protein 2 [Notolabrus celidotus]